MANFVGTIKTAITSKLTPAGIAVDAAKAPMKKIIKYGGSAFTGLGLYFMSMGQAAYTGFLAGAAGGAAAGAIGGGIVGFQIGVALAPVTFGVSIPVFTALGAAGGGIVGATVLGLAGGMIGLGLASGSGTALSMGIGAGVGGSVGAVVGFNVGAGLTAAALTAAIGVCIASVVCAPFAPFLVAVSPAIVWMGGFIGGTIGAYVGAAAGATIGYFANKIAAGAGHAAVSTISSLWNGLASGVGNLFGAIGSGINYLLASSGVSVPTSAIAAVVFGTPLAIGVVATVGFIGINSAFLSTDVPSAPIFPGQNQYFTLAKTVTGPSHLENSSLPTNISFQISLTAKVNLNNIQVSDELKVQARSGNPSVTTDSNNKPVSPPCADKLPQSLSVNQAWTCDLSITAQQNFADSFTINTVTVKATPEGQKEITDFATATATIGNPPTICAIVDLQGPWAGNEKNNVLQACQAFDLSPKAVSLLQNAGKITIIRLSNGSYGNNVCGSVNGANVIGIACSLNTVPFAKYVINHEMGHIIGNFNGPTYQTFLNSGIFQQEGLTPTYPQDVSSNSIVGPNESFAEMITEYMNSKIYSHPPRNWFPKFPPAKNYPGGPWDNPGGGYITFPQDRPLHYNFTKNNIFGGTIY